MRNAALGESVPLALPLLLGSFTCVCVCDFAAGQAELGEDGVVEDTRKSLEQQSLEERERDEDGEGVAHTHAHSGRHKSVFAKTCTQFPPKF